jgi:hypothetical protein
MSGSKVDPEADKMNLLLTELVTMKEQQATMFEQQTLLLAISWAEAGGTREDDA